MSSSRRSYRPKPYRRAELERGDRPLNDHEAAWIARRPIRDIDQELDPLLQEARQGRYPSRELSDRIRELETRRDSLLREWQQSHQEPHMRSVASDGCRGSSNVQGPGASQPRGPGRREDVYRPVYQPRPRGVNHQREHAMRSRSPDGHRSRQYRERSRSYGRRPDTPQVTRARSPPNHRYDWPSSDYRTPTTHVSYRRRSRSTGRPGDKYRRRSRSPLRHTGTKVQFRGERRDDRPQSQVEELRPVTMSQLIPQSIMNDSPMPGPSVPMSQLVPGDLPHGGKEDKQEETQIPLLPVADIISRDPLSSDAAIVDHPCQVKDSQAGARSTSAPMAANTCGTTASHDATMVDQPNGVEDSQGVTEQPVASIPGSPEEVVTPVDCAVTDLPCTNMDLQGAGTPQVGSPITDDEDIFVPVDFGDVDELESCEGYLDPNEAALDSMFEAHEDASSKPKHKEVEVIAGIDLQHPLTVPEVKALKPSEWTINEEADSIQANLRTELARVKRHASKQNSTLGWSASLWHQTEDVINAFLENGSERVVDGYSFTAKSAICLAPNEQSSSWYNDDTIDFALHLLTRDKTAPDFCWVSTRDLLTWFRVTNQAFTWDQRVACLEAELQFAKENEHKLGSHGWEYQYPFKESRSGFARNRFPLQNNNNPGAINTVFAYNPSGSHWVTVESSRSGSTGTVLIRNSIKNRDVELVKGRKELPLFFELASLAENSPYHGVTSWNVSQVSAYLQRGAVDCGPIMVQTIVDRCVHKKALPLATIVDAAPFRAHVMQTVRRALTGLATPDQSPGKPTSAGTEPRRSEDSCTLTKADTKPLQLSPQVLSEHDPVRETYPDGHQDLGLAISTDSGQILGTTEIPMTKHRGALDIKLDRLSSRSDKRSFVSGIAGRRWTEADNRKLIQLGEEGVKLDDIAKALQRTSRAIERQRWKLQPIVGELRPIVGNETSEKSPDARHPQEVLDELKRKLDGPGRRKRSWYTTTHHHQIADLREKGVSWKRIKEDLDLPFTVDAIKMNFVRFDEEAVKRKKTPKYYTLEDDIKLLEMRIKNVPFMDIAATLSRSSGSLTRRYYRLVGGSRTADTELSPRAWTTEEDRALATHEAAGKDREEIAITMGRTRSAVHTRVHQLRHDRVKFNQMLADFKADPVTSGAAGSPIIPGSRPWTDLETAILWTGMHLHVDEQILANHLSRDEQSVRDQTSRIAPNGLQSRDRSEQAEDFVLPPTEDFFPLESKFDGFILVCRWSEEMYLTFELKLAIRDGLTTRQNIVDQILQSALQTYRNFFQVAEDQAPCLHGGDRLKSRWLPALESTVEWRMKHPLATIQQSSSYDRAFEFTDRILQDYQKLKNKTIVSIGLDGWACDLDHILNFIELHGPFTLVLRQDTKLPPTFQEGRWRPDVDAGVWWATFESEELDHAIRYYNQTWDANRDDVTALCHEWTEMQRGKDVASATTTGRFRRRNRMPQDDTMPIDPALLDEATDSLTLPVGVDDITANDRPRSDGV